MRLTNHRSHHVAVSALSLAVGIAIALPTTAAAHLSSMLADTRSQRPHPIVSSTCEGRWGHPRYKLDISQAGEDLFEVFFVPKTANNDSPFSAMGEVTWGKKRQPGHLGTLDRHTFKADFAGYGPVELTCTPQGPVDQYGRRLTPRPEDEQDVATTANEVQATPSWKDVQSATADAARMSRLMPYLDDPDEAAAVTYPDLPGWLFFRTAAFCYLVREKDDGRLLIGYNRATNTAHVGFTADKLAPLAAGTKLKLDIVMANMNDRTRKAQPVRYWDPVPATVLIGRRSYEPVYNFKLNGRQALISFSRHDAVLFMKGEEALQGFSLDGSAAAIKRLETCEPR